MRTIIRKGQGLGNLVPAITALVFAGILLVFLIHILSELKATIWQDLEPAGNWTSDVIAVTNNTIEGMGSFADYWTLIVLAIVVGIIISLLMAVFAGRRAVS